MSDAVPVIAMQGIEKVYKTGEVIFQALRGVDLTLHEGEFTVLLGPSGSGKSTLLNLLGGLDRPTAGEVRYRGRAVDFDDDRALTRFRREHVGFVFQFYNLVASLTARPIRRSALSRRSRACSGETTRSVTAQPSSGGVGS